MDISEIIKGLKGHGVDVVREPDRYSFGDRESCRYFFEQLFKNADLTIKEFKYLPEYEHVVQWMMDTKGTGLCLYGDCGRGKSTILTGVVPMLLYVKKKILHPYQASEVPDKAKIICKEYAIIIDEVGTEIQANEWGEKYEGFNLIMDAAESKMKMVFISTNLTRDQLIARYGIRTWERINRLCRVVPFKGGSLR